MIIVQKYGGSSVADNEKLFNVANKIKKEVEVGNSVVVVVSAQGKTTDMLIEKARQIDPKCSKRELDVLLSTGEQQSMALLSMMLGKIGIPAVSLTGEQAGIFTTGQYQNARIDDIRPFRIFNELEKGNVVVVAGFQGVDYEGDINTLGRGGSDTTAVALAYGVNADRCDIYSDVDAIYTADPRIVKDAIRLEKISYDSMLELATLGAKVLNSRAVELAKKFDVKLMSAGSMASEEGTKIVRESMESASIAGITADRNVAVITIYDLYDNYDLFIKLAKHNIPVDVIGQSIGLKEISFTVKEDMIEEVKAVIGSKYDIGIEKECAKVSIVGTGMINKPEIAGQIYKSLTGAKIQIKLISSSETKFSVIVESKYVDVALNAIHNEIFRK